MKYIKRLGIILPAAALFLSTLVISTSAQVRSGVSVRRGSNRPVAVRRAVIVRRPFWRHRGYWGRGWYDPFYDPYYNNPYLRHLETKYYREKAVRDARKELRKHQEKYEADGVITAKEREELYENQRDLQKATEKLRKFNRDG